ncbi:MAG: hypothetical protein U0R52_13500 [Solirubrobacterales bacterium]
MAMIDDGDAIHYTAVERGTPVYSSDGVEVGRVEEILDNYREHIFDGIVFRDPRGAARFADAPEVARTATRGVRLNIDAERAASLPPPEPGQGTYRPLKGTAGRISRLFGGGWKRQ